MGTGRSDEEVWACNSVEMKQMSSKCAVREQAKVRLNRCARLFTEYVTTHPTSPLLCDHSPTSSKIAKVTKVTVSESRGFLRSEERRGGKECRSRWSPYHYNKQKCARGPSARACSKTKKPEPRSRPVLCE